MKTIACMPKLAYGAEDLAPVISKETIDFHYGKHLQTYVTNLNKLVENTEFVNMSLEEIATKAEGGIGNNAGQVLNHTLYFEQFASKPNKTAPEGKLLKAIQDSFGGFEQMKEQFSNAASTLFGSGWAWLCEDKDGKLHIKQMFNADNPLRHEMKPLLTFDVWEHAYYLDYQNRRADYINALWSIINWEIIEKRF